MLAWRGFWEGGTAARRKRGTDQDFGAGTGAKAEHKEGKQRSQCSALSEE